MDSSNKTHHRVGLIGAGNLAWNLAMALRDSPWHPVQVISRNPKNAESFASEFGIEHFGSLPEHLRTDLDLVIICSTDHVIGEIAQSYAGATSPGTAFVHTAGSVSKSALLPLGPSTGVFYPLQTFTKGHLADFSKVPIFLEGPDEVMEKTRPLADHLSREVHVLNSEGRLKLHLGAVFASNFANFMWLMAEDAVSGLDKLDLKIYQPLVEECVTKAFTYGPLASQTGPAKRGDLTTMGKHLQILQSGDPEREKLYRLISEMILHRFQLQSPDNQ